MINCVTLVINEYVKKKKSQDRAFWHSGIYLKRYGESTRNTNPRLYVD
jgi:hypothetical protein